jgi:hypothetical protein
VASRRLRLAARERSGEPLFAVCSRMTFVAFVILRRWLTVGLSMRWLLGRFRLRRLLAASAVSAMIAAASGATALARQQPGAAPGPERGRADVGEPELRRQLKSLIAENENASKRYTEEIRQLKTDGEKQAYNRANWPPEKRVVGRMLELARRNPQDPTSFDALAWVAILGFNTTECD